MSEYEGFVRAVLRRSLRICPKENVIVESWNHGLDIAREFVYQLRAIGARPMNLVEDEEGYWRLTGALSILVAAITLMVPVFHRFSREEVAAMQAEADPLLVVEEELARVKKRLIELENKRRMLLGRTADGSEDRPAN